MRKIEPEIIIFFLNRENLKPRKVARSVDFSLENILAAFG